MLCAAALKTGEVVQWLEDTLKDHVRDLGKLAGPNTELSSDVLGSEETLKGRIPFKSVILVNGSGRGRSERVGGGGGENCHSMRSCPL